MFKDYYAILEIPQTATLFEIKAAYRTQAKKWHPDKNLGRETAEKMKDINEARLILADDDARVRYDRGYLKFKLYQKVQEEIDWKSKHEKYQRAEKGGPRKKTHAEQTPTPPKESSSYEIDDEILEKWMENASRQAVRNLYAMVTEFRDSSIIGFGTFFTSALKFIVIAAIALLVFMIISIF